MYTGLCLSQDILVSFYVRVGRAESGAIELLPQIRRSSLVRNVSALCVVMLPLSTICCSWIDCDVAVVYVVNLTNCRNSAVILWLSSPLTVLLTCFLSPGQRLTDIEFLFLCWNLNKTIFFSQKQKKEWE